MVFDKCLFSPEKLFLLLHFKDISKSKKAEKALKESEQKFRSLFETMALGVTLPG